jgi:hypothetical protein
MGQSAGPIRSNPFDAEMRGFAAAIFQAHFTGEHAASHTLLDAVFPLDLWRLGQSERCG